MVFHLVGVGGGYRVTALDVTPPLADLRFELLVGIHHDHPSAEAGGSWTERHTWLRASATTSHWARRSASISRPAAVIV